MGRVTMQGDEVHMWGSGETCELEIYIQALSRKSTDNNWGNKFPAGHQALSA